MSSKRQASFYSSHRNKVLHSSYGTIRVPIFDVIHPPIYIPLKQANTRSLAYLKRWPSHGQTKLVNELKIIEGVIFLSDIGISNLQCAVQHGHITQRFQDYHDQYIGVRNQIQTIAQHWNHKNQKSQQGSLV
jgi:hypothetical protein